MFLLFVFVYSLAGPYSSLHSANAGAGDEKLTTAEPRNINEVYEQIKKYIKKDYILPYQQNVALDVHTEWCLKAAQVEQTLIANMNNKLANKQRKLDNMQLELERLKVKLSLRNEVHNQFSIISPVWLRYLPVKMKYKWQLLLQTESEITERLKSIITNQMNITVDQFCNDMDVFEEQAARDIHRDNFPHLESEDKMMNILQSIGFKKGTIKKSIVALAFHFRNLNNTAYVKDDYKYYFLYFPFLKMGTSANEIIDFMNLYFDHQVVYHQNVTILENDRNEEGDRAPQHIEAFVRLNVAITNQEGEVIRVLPLLRQILDEIRDIVTATSEATAEIAPLKKSFIDKCGENAVPLIIW